MKFKQIISICLSFIILLAISCVEAAYAPADVGSDIPTASGNPATVGDVSFAGTLTRTKLEGMSETEAESGTAPATLTVPSDFGLEIKDSKIDTGLGGTLTGIQLLTQTDSKVVEASGETVSEEEGITIKEYVKITLDNASSPTTAQVEYQMKQSGSVNFSVSYTGTLTKDTSSGASI